MYLIEFTLLDHGATCFKGQPQLEGWSLDHPEECRTLVL
jgi:hypothetical protein